VPLCVIKQRNLVLAMQRAVMLSGGKVTAGLAKSMAAYTASFMASAICVLTAQDQDHLQTPDSASRTR